MGTPDIAATCLQKLLEAKADVVAVYTKIDTPKNRGMKLTPSPVKEVAVAAGIPVIQPTTFKDEAVVEELRALKPDVIAAVAYGKILPEDLLNTPRLGSINVHSSLLPEYRGAAPINWAILDGKEETGVSIMYMAKDLDAGDVILQKTTRIGDRENAQQLTERLAELGAQALSETVDALANGTATCTRQDESKQTYASMLSKEMSPIDWHRSAHEISCQIRGLIPWPCATTDVISGESMKIYDVIETGETSAQEAGTIVAADKKGIDVVCGDQKILRIVELQAQGSKRMAAAAYLLGHPIQL